MLIGLSQKPKLKFLICPQNLTPYLDRTPQTHTKENPVPVLARVELLFMNQDQMYIYKTFILNTCDFISSM